MSSSATSSKTSSSKASSRGSSSSEKIGEPELDMSKWQSTLQGGLSFAMSESVLEEGQLAMATERYNIKQKDDELTRHINRLHDQQMAVCEQMKKHANSKGIDVYEKLLFKVRWADPELSLWQQSLIVDYVQHLLGPDPKRIFPGERIMRAMFEKTKGRRAEKAHGEILKLINRIRSIILYNDGKVADIKSALKEQETKMIVKKAGQLRWLMEANTGRKDRFWTTWYFASHGMAAPLQRHLTSLKKKSDAAHLAEHGGGEGGETGWNQRLARDEDWRKGITPTSKNDVDARDPDFGLTALHYASKTSNLQVVKVLLEFGANPNIRAPDGRTALHFAAAYSTRQVMIELLGHEADLDAVDHFGCTPEIMAEQNENRTTWLVLQRWKTLVPVLPERPVTPEAEEFIPEAFRAVPEEVVERMSKPLQAIARRLTPPQDMVNDAQEWLEEKEEDRKHTERNKWLSQGVSEAALDKHAESVRLDKEKRDYGVDPSVELTDDMRLELEAERQREEEKARIAKKKGPRKGQPMSPIVELRLCQKYAEMCFKESFVEEGLKGLRRRWETSRKLLAAEKERMTKLLKLRAQHTTTRRHQGRDISISVDMETPGSAFGATDAASVGSSAHSLGDSTMDSSTATDDDGRYAKQAAGYSLHACVSCGRELAEALISHNQEGFAATVLEECLMLSGVPRLASETDTDKDKNLTKAGGSPTNRIHFQDSATHSQYHAGTGLTNLESSTTVALLARRCEVLLCVWDLLLRDTQETTRTKPFPAVAADQYGAHYENVRRESIASLAEVLSPSKVSLIQSLADAPVDYSMEYNSQAAGARPGGQLDLSVEGSLDQFPSVLTANTGEYGQEQTESMASKEQKKRAYGGHPSEEDSSAWYQSNFQLSPSKAYLEKQPIPPMQEPSAVTSVAESVEDQTFIGFGYVGSNFQLYQRILTVAVQCRDSIDLAVDIVTAGSSELLVEPFVLVSLLELRAEVYEREEDIENSVLCLMRAESCSKRSMGQYSLETLQVMLELLRVLIKCGTPEGMTAATEKATELGHVLDKMEEIKRKAADEEEKKKTDIYAILRKRSAAKERKKAEALADKKLEAEEAKSSSYADAQKLVDLMESGADRKRLGGTGRRGAATQGDTSKLNHHDAEEDVEDTGPYHRKAMELISLAKLLDCKMETMPSLFGNSITDSEKGENRDHSGGKGGGRRMSHKKGGGGAGAGRRRSTTSSPGGSMSHFSVVNSVLGRKEALRKEEEEERCRAALEAEDSTVYTGRVRPVKDTSQTLAIPTSDSLQQGDGKSSKVRKGTTSAQTAPHEHQESLFKERASKGKKGSRITFANIDNEPSHMDSHMDVEEEEEEEKKLLTRHKAADLAMAGLRASRMLSRPTYYQVPLEPRVKRAFIPTPPVEEEEEKTMEASAAYYSQLQTRSLTHDVTKAAMRRSAELQRELSTSLRGSPHRSTYLSEQPPGPGVGTSPFTKRKERADSLDSSSAGVASHFDTTREEAVLARERKSQGPPSPIPSTVLSKEQDTLLTEVQRQSLQAQKQKIDEIDTKESEAEMNIRSPYESAAAKIRAGADSVTARASYLKQDGLSSAQRLVMANVHGTVNLGTRHRLERLVKERPGLKGLIRDSGSAADPLKVLVETDTASREKGDTHSAERADMVALSSTGVGSIVHTGTAVVSMPHTAHAVTVAPEVRKHLGTGIAAKLVSSAVAEEKAAMPPPSHSLNAHSVQSSLGDFDSLGKLPSTKPRGRDKSARKYSDKKESTGEGPEPVPIVRYRDGEWKVERQEEAAATHEMLHSTSLASLSKSIADIEEQREEKTLDKSFYL